MMQFEHIVNLGNGCVLASVDSENASRLHHSLMLASVEEAVHTIKTLCAMLATEFVRVNCGDYEIAIKYPAVDVIDKDGNVRYHRDLRYERTNVELASDLDWIMKTLGEINRRVTRIETKLDGGDCEDDD